MTDDEREDWQTRVSDLMGDFATGIGLLMVFAGRDPTTVSREEMLGFLEPFEAAVGPLAELQAAGQFEMGGGILSAEVGDWIKRLGVLVRLPPESAEAEAARAEIRTLSEQCLQSLIPKVLASAKEEP